LDFRKVKRCVDTVGVWGSNPHAPTIFYCVISLLLSFLHRSRHIWQTFGRLTIFLEICNSRRFFHPTELIQAPGNDYKKHDRFLSTTA
jgi:hypothetical protein